MDADRAALAVRNGRVAVTGHGGPDVLEAVSDSATVPGAGQVQVTVLAAGASPFDLMHRRWGHLPGRPKLPFTLGEDIVDQLADVARLQTVPGTRRRADRR